VRRRPPPDHAGYQLEQAAPVLARTIANSQNDMLTLRIFLVDH